MTGFDRYLHLRSCIYLVEKKRDFMDISFKSRLPLSQRISNILFESPSDSFTISVKLFTISQFFNTFDPSPFHKRDMDLDAEEYIYTAAEEIYLLNTRRVKGKSTFNTPQNS
jgi:hypothetical protein